MLPRIGRIVSYPYSSFIFIGIGLISAFQVILVLEAELLNTLAQEGHYIENATVFFYFVAAAALLLQARHDIHFFVSSTLIVCLLAARELDLHKAFTTDSVLKSAYYVRDGAPWPEKVIAATIILCLVTFVLHYAWLNWHRLVQGLRRRHAAAWSLASALVLLPLTKLLDAGPRILEDDFSIDLSDSTRRSFLFLEEFMEMIIPLIILWAIWQYHRDHLFLAHAENTPSRLRQGDK